MSRNRKATSEFEPFFSATAEPIYAVDAQRRIVLFNGACERLTGRNADEILGCQCQEADPPPRDQPTLTTSLCPPPGVFQGRQASQAARIPVASGGWEQRTVDFVPCHDEEGNLLFVLAFIKTGRATRPANADKVPSLVGQLERLRSGMLRRYGFDQLICQSRPMQRVLGQIKAASDSDAAILVVGEAGTGKELVARTIHYASPRCDLPFVPIDCAVLPPQVLDRTLATLLRSGEETPAFYASPLANPPGTVFLDEVLQLPRDYQARLVPLISVSREAGVLDSEREPTPRLIATTTEDPQQAVSDGTLREDLFYALTTFILEVPPLRERREDIPLLAQHFLEEENGRSERRVGSLSDEACEILTAYDWPGNVRELAETVATAHSRAAGDRIQVGDLPMRIRSAVQGMSAAPARDELALSLDELLVRVETRVIRLALERARGNKSRAAEILGISRPRLYRRIEVLGVEEQQQSNASQQSEE